jgi:hypothetical protein
LLKHPVVLVGKADFVRFVPALAAVLADSHERILLTFSKDIGLLNHQDRPLANPAVPILLVNFQKTAGNLSDVFFDRFHVI